MTEPDRTGSSQGRDPNPEINLPSWVDAAIAKSRGGEESAPSPVDDEPEVEAPTDEAEEVEATLDALTAEPEEVEALGEDAIAEVEDVEASVEDATEPVIAEESLLDDEAFERSPSATAPPEPFPSFLDRRRSMEMENERVASRSAPEDAPELELEPGDVEPVPFEEEEAVAPDEFDARRAALVAEALGQEPAPRAEPIPLPVAPPRRRPASGPWLMAALFFAAAALVLAVLIWLRPLPR